MVFILYLPRQIACIAVPTITMQPAEETDAGMTETCLEIGLYLLIVIMHWLWFLQKTSRALVFNRRIISHGNAACDDYRCRRPARAGTNGTNAKQYSICRLFASRVGYY